VPQTAPTRFNFCADIVESWAAATPDAPAFWWVGDAGDVQRVSFRLIASKARQAAHAFAVAGVRPGDRVLVVLPRVPQWWTAMLGLIRLGAVPIPGTPLLTPHDIAYRLEAAEVSAILTDADGATKIDSLLAPKNATHAAFGATATPRILQFVVGLSDRPGWINYDSALRDADPTFDPPSTPADSPSLLYFTSGTTGQPKMVLHTQTSYGLAHATTAKYWLDLKPSDLHWNLSDTGWAKAAWSSLFAPWHTGSCIFALEGRGKFDPAHVLRTLADYPITTWCAPPTALRMIVREDLTAFRPRSLRHCVSAGEPLNPEVIATWHAATGLSIYEGYGQTETVCTVAHSRSLLGDTIRPGSMGQPIPGYDVVILTPDLHEAPPDTEGHLALRVKPTRPLGLFKEYWKNPDENAARFVGDYYLTGDVARPDADGNLWFVGRTDDVIKSSGYRIGPFEVESALIEHPAVMEAAVVAKPDDTRGQIVKAFVVLRKTAAACDALKLELQEHCKRVTAPYKYPREIEFLTELPKTISGKIRRVELRGKQHRASDRGPILPDHTL
jgi:acetyl-CoA synthetase/medium-chain acyl-CoA synthetase